MQIEKRHFFQLIFIFLGLLAGNFAKAQKNPFKDKKVGVYISSKSFTYPEELYLNISQFIGIMDKDAWAGRQKSEFIIRLGWMICEQLKELGEVDSVAFLNADLARGSLFQNAYDGLNNRMITPREPLDLDYVLVFSPFEMTTRIHKSVYIRSNRMVTDRINVKIINFETALFKANGDRDPKVIKICFDEQKGTKPSAHYFDFHRKESGLGKFLSFSFSHWWEAVRNGSDGNCE